ncbi:hypothetical protein [Streptomyces koelreuteriae]|uniref:Uncharacterized protein n=1 Tax=Streptomyces koelreuteriae TaxID=2838015 RepID=A0ABX8G2N8_9ACTN|nr:hypothetical protein [Streptomyces koelreuteriae]QWB27800.1 hypothetical protein KJK29_37280 [Streptomyces koelreuteriae]
MSTRDSATRIAITAMRSAGVPVSSPGSSTAAGQVSKLRPMTAAIDVPWYPQVM